MYTLNAEERARELDMMKRPSRWPLWPYLPVKRVTRDSPWPQLGFMIEEVPITPTEEKAALPTVHLATIHDIANGKYPSFAGIPTKEYVDLDAVLDDGWVVD